MFLIELWGKAVMDSAVPPGMEDASRKICFFAVLLVCLMGWFLRAVAGNHKIISFKGLVS